MGRQTANQLKVKKQARMRRAYLKHYSGMIKVGQTVDKSKVPRGAEGIIDYRHRGNTYWDTVVENILGEVPLMISEPRRVAIYKSRLACINELNCLTQEVVPEMNVVLQRGGITKTVLRFFYSSDYTTCFFMYEDWLGGYILKSGVYGSKDRAILAFELSKSHLVGPKSKINWMHRIPLPINE